MPAPRLTAAQKAERGSRIQVAVRLDPPTHDRLVVEADRRAVSLQWLIARAVSRLLEDLPPLEQ